MVNKKSTMQSSETTRLEKAFSAGNYILTRKLATNMLSNSTLSFESRSKVQSILQQMAFDSGVIWLSCGSILLAFIVAALLLH